MLIRLDNDGTVIRTLGQRQNPEFSKNNKKMNQG